MTREWDLVIVGGGAAGLFAAARAAGRGCSVAVLEKMEQCGRKIGITGKGRCNLTNARPWPEFEEHIHPQGAFFKSAFFAMDNVSTMAFFEKIGLPLTLERGRRVFPRSMKARDVTDALVNHIRRNGGEIITGCAVESVSSLPDGGFSVVRAGGGEPFARARAVIVATGGLSYPATGSTGDGYRIAESFGHAVTPCLPSLTALRPAGYGKEYEGISLKNVEVRLLIDGREAAGEFGDLDFTDGGIEGPLGFRLSRKAVQALHRGQQVELQLDLKPAVSCEQLALRIGREWDGRDRRVREEAGGKEKYLLHKLLPAPLVNPFLRAHPGLRTEKLPEALKRWTFPIISHVGYERAVVTAGGVDLKEISRKTMESKRVKGLYFAGEVLDLDGDTGGYNLQIAFSTAAAAAEHVLLTR